MVNDNLKTNGIVSLVLSDENGNIKDIQTHNMVMQLGLAYITSRMKDATATTMTHIAVGVGTTAPANTQTTLISESARSALSSTVQVTTTTTNDAIQYVATFAPGVATAALTEAGIFNASAANTGTMLARTVFPVVNKGANDTLTITWKITLA